MFRKSSTGTRLIAEAKDRASQLSQWLDDRVDVDDIADPMREGTRRVVESARDQLEDVSAWLTDIVDTLEQASKDDKGSNVSRLAKVAAGAAGWYFLHPSYGPERRRRATDYLRGLRQRFA